MGLSDHERRQAEWRAKEAITSLQGIGIDLDQIVRTLRMSQSPAALLKQQSLVAKLDTARTASAFGLSAAAVVTASAWGINRATAWFARTWPGLRAAANSAQLVQESAQGALDSFASVAQQLSGLSATIQELQRAYIEAFPPNLRGIPGLSISRLCDFLAEEGIALYIVPRQSIADAFLTAPDHATVRALLSSRAKFIIADCRQAWEDHRTQHTSQWIAFLDHGVGAYEAGHTKAAQALFAVVLDSMTFALPTQDRRRVTKHPNGQTDYDHLLESEENLATAMIAISLWHVHEQNWAADGHPVPAEFNRHATLHRVSKRQYSKRNAIQSLMLATSLLAWFSAYGRHIG